MQFRHLEADLRDDPVDGIDLVVGERHLRAAIRDGALGHRDKERAEPRPVILERGGEQLRERGRLAPARPRVAEANCSRRAREREVRILARMRRAREEVGEGRRQVGHELRLAQGAGHAANLRSCP